jgi:hypothetical protein
MQYNQGIVWRLGCRRGRLRLKGTGLAVARGNQRDGLARVGGDLPPLLGAFGGDLPTSADWGMKSGGQWRQWGGFDAAGLETGLRVNSPSSLETAGQCGADVQSDWQQIRVALARSG